MGILKLVPLEERIVLDAAIASVVLHVTNGHDSGTGSLRAAIATANAASGVDTIEFTLSPTFNGTVNLTSGPLDITHAVNILGNGQVTVNGAASSDVFDVNASKTTLSGLTIVGQTQGLSAGAGVELNGNNDILTNDTILSNHYGVLDNGGNNTFTSDFVGTNSAGSTSGGNDFGLYLNGTGNDTISNDVISNNISTLVTYSNYNKEVNGGGIYIEAATAGHDLITNNDIGTNPKATATLDNGTGIFSLAGNLTITGNTIAGYNLTSTNTDQTAVGVWLGGANNLVANNDFDLSFNQHGVATSLPSTEYAVTSSIFVTSANNQVLNNDFGGTSQNSINIAAGSTNDLIQGNYIGVTPEGQNLGGGYYLNQLAIYIGQAANINILDNVIANQYVQPQNQVGAGVFAINDTGIDTMGQNPASLPNPSNVKIEGNLIYNIANNNDLLDASFGIYSQYFQNVTISNNIINNLGYESNGIYSISEQNVSINNNTVTNSQATLEYEIQNGFYNQGIGSYQDTNEIIANNNVSGDDDVGILPAAVTNGLIENNLIQNATYSPTDPYEDNGADGIRICDYSTNVTILNNTILNSDIGIAITNTDKNVNVTNDLLLNDQIGIYVPLVNNQINVTNTTIIGGQYGVYLDPNVIEYGVGPASGNTLTISNTLIEGESQAGVAGDFSMNTIALYNDSLINDNIGIDDLSSSPVRNITVHDVLFLLNRENYNW